MSEALVPYQAQMSLAETMELGKAMAASGYFSDSREAAQAVVKILAGRELGFGPVASMTGINVIKGKITLSANLIAASVKRSGRYNYRVVKMDNDGCSIDFYEGGDKIGNSTFTAADAKTAGLAGDNWRKFPKNMLFARAMSNGAKWFCPDLSGGPLYTPDELGATIDGETGEMIDVTPQTISPTDLHAPVEPPQGRPKNGNGGKTPTADWVFARIQELTGGYYNHPSHLLHAVGDWPDFANRAAVKEFGEKAVAHAEQRRAEKAGEPEAVEAEAADATDEIPW